MIILSMGLVTLTVHTCFQIKHRKRRLQYHSSGRLDKCSFLTTCPSLENQYLWDRWDSGRKSSVFKLEATAELPLSNLAPLPS